LDLKSRKLQSYAPAFAIPIVVAVSQIADWQFANLRIESVSEALARAMSGSSAAVSRVTRRRADPTNKSN